MIIYYKPETVIITQENDTINCQFNGTDNTLYNFRVSQGLWILTSDGSTILATGSIDTTNSLQLNDVVSALDYNGITLKDNYIGLSGN